MSIYSQDIKLKKYSQWHESRVITLIFKVAKMPGNKPNLDIVNTNAYVKFCENQSICT